MRRFLWLIVVVPMTVIVLIVAVANRKDVRFAVDPFGILPADSALNIPLFVLLFAALLLGIVLGGVATWLGQGRWRRAARRERARAARLREENDRLRERGAATSTALIRPGSVRDAA